MSNDFRSPRPTTREDRLLTIYLCICFVTHNLFMPSLNYVQILLVICYHPGLYLLSGVTALLHKLVLLTSDFQTAHMFVEMIRELKKRTQRAENKQELIVKKISNNTSIE